MMIVKGPSRSARKLNNKYKWRRFNKQQEAAKEAFENHMLSHVVDAWAAEQNEGGDD